jgi:HAD superfamily hydrolase (TIGR01549 family)
MDVAKVGFAVYDDLLETLAQIRIRNIRMAVVTNRVDARLEEHLTSFGIAVDATVSSASVGYRKPHPAVFEAALRRLDVTPKEAIEVGDSYEVDVLGAKRAGMKSVLKLNDREDRLEWVVDYKIRNLSELLPVLDSLADA